MPTQNAGSAIARTETLTGRSDAQPDETADDECQEQRGPPHQSPALTSVNVRSLIGEALRVQNR